MWGWNAFSHPGPLVGTAARRIRVLRSELNGRVLMPRSCGSTALRRLFLHVGLAGFLSGVAKERGMMIGRRDCCSTLKGWSSSALRARNRYAAATEAARCCYRHPGSGCSRGIVLDKRRRRIQPRFSEAHCERVGVGPRSPCGGPPYHWSWVCI